MPLPPAMPRSAGPLLKPLPGQCVQRPLHCPPAARPLPALSLQGVSHKAVLVKDLPGPVQALVPRRLVLGIQAHSWGTLGPVNLEANAGSRVPQPKRSGKTGCHASRAAGPRGGIRAVGQDLPVPQNSRPSEGDSPRAALWGWRNSPGSAPTSGSSVPGSTAQHTGPRGQPCPPRRRGASDARRRADPRGPGHSPRGQGTWSHTPPGDTGAQPAEGCSVCSRHLTGLSRPPASLHF